MIGIDSCALIDLFKEDKNLIESLQGFNEDINLNMFVYAELLIGIDLDNPGHKDELEFYEEVFSRFKNFNIDKESIKLHSKIYWDLKKRGKIISPSDCLIASTYLVNGVDKIITKNKKHFENIKGLKVLTY